MQPATRQAPGGHPPATDTELEGPAALAHQVATAHEEQRQRGRLRDGRPDRGQQGSPASAAAVAIVDTHPDDPAGQVSDADVDLDPVLMDVETGRVNVRLDQAPSSPPTWATSGSSIRLGCR
jgi:hypothetical protein